MKVVDFLNDYRAAHTSTLIQLFYPSVAVGCRRLSALVEAGEIKRERGNVSIQYAYYIKRPAQLRHALALTDFYAAFSLRYEIKHFAREPTIGNIRPDAMIGYMDGPQEIVEFVEVELSNKGLNLGKYITFEQLERQKYFEVRPRLIVVTDKNYQSCERYEVWHI
jgi:hypothetical protein